MEEISLRIGEQLKEIRKTRKLSLDALSEITGVSKPMLGQIERGQSSPTINTLWKISTGLKIPLSFLCRKEEARYILASVNEKDKITEEDGKMRVYPLFAFDPLRNAEAFYIEFDPKTKHRSLAHDTGVEEYILMVYGTLKVVIGEKEIVLKEKQSLRFDADIAHVYHNISDQPCAVYNMIFYSK